MIDLVVLLSVLAAIVEIARLARRRTVARMASMRPATAKELAEYRSTPGGYR
jgi:uncharacterized DUF497 family protein